MRKGLGRYAVHAHCKRNNGVMLIVFALAFGSTAPAQHGARPLSQYSQLVYGLERGLPQSDVRSIAQTPNGYLWFGTRDGLARFDGVRFVVFRKEDTPGIGHNMFGALLVDRLGRLWIATGDGLSCYEHGQFRRYTQVDGLPANAIHSLFEDRSGTLWIGTWNGLAAFDGHKFRTYTNGLSNRSVSGISEDGYGGLWIGTFGGGIAHFSNGRFTLLTRKDGLPSDVVITVLRDRSGRLWAGTLLGFAQLGPAERFRPVPELPVQAQNLYEDREGEVWAVSDGRLARLAGDSGSVFRPEQSPAPEVETLFEDREKTLWIGTTSGVVRCRAGAFVSYTIAEGLASNAAETVFEDSKGALWVGTTKGISRWFQEEMRTVSRAVAPVSSISEDDQGRIWAGTPHGVSIFDGKFWKQLPDIHTDVHVIYRDRAGRMWVGSTEGAIVDDHSHIGKLTQADGLPGHYVKSILEDREGAFWFGTSTGLARVHRGKVTSYTSKNGLRSDFIQCLYEDGEGTLWVGTPGGIHRFKNGRFQAITEANGMLSDTTLTIIEDDQRRFWLTSYRGVCRVQRDELNAVADGRKSRVSCIVYGAEDGMKSAVFAGLGRQPAGWKTRSGRLWFPTETGVVTVDPARMAPQDPPPSALLETVLADGIATSGPRVGPDVRRVEFVFSAPTSLAPESIEFRYRMPPFEPQWREAGTQRRISFTNLPSGAYRFAVSARRSGSDWSARDAFFEIEILPHFYETRWFYTCGGLLFLLLLWCAHSIRLHQTERRLSAVMAERSRVAQELHDTLLQSLSGTAMQIQAALRRLSQGAMESGLEQLSAALAHLGKSMADARQAIHGLNNPELEELPLDAALKAVADRLCADGPLLTYKISGTPMPLESRLEQHIYRIGAEAVGNAVRHSGCKSVFVELSYCKECFGLSVSDDGSGFDPPGAASASSRGNHWGLTGMRGRAVQCGGQLRIRSAAGAGTRVEFEVPLLRRIEASAGENL